MPRPSLGAYSRQSVISASVTKNEFDFIDQLADRFGVSRSFITRRILAIFTNNFTKIECLDNHILVPKQIEILLAASDYQELKCVE